MIHKLILIIKLFIYLIILSLFCVFIINNGNIVELNLYPFEYIIETKLFIIILISFFIGFSFSFFTDILTVIRELKKKMQRYKKMKQEKLLLELKNKKV